MAPDYSKVKRVNGRRTAIAVIDRMVADPENLERLEKALQEAFTADPLKVWDGVIRPLIPPKMLEDDDTSTPEELARLIGQAKVEMGQSVRGMTADGTQEVLPDAAEAETET